MDPKREQDPFTRREIARRIHFLEANVGLPKRILTGLTNLIVGSGLWPKALTTDREWNKLADNYYFNRAKSAVSFDVTGKFAGGEFQRQAVRTRLRDADAAVVYSFSETGRTLRKLYSGLQIGNSTDQGTGRFDQDRWIDGVFIDALERPALYRFLTQEGTRSKDLASRDLAFLAKYPSPGAVRGTSVLAHAVNKLIDVTEIHTSLVQNFKNSASIGYYLAASNTPSSAQGMPAEVIKKLYKGQTQQVDGPNGQKVTLKLVMGQGNEIVELPPGYDIKTLLDSRPHPNQVEFLDELVRDIAWGSDLSFDLLWKIYKLGGANTRYMLADAQVFAETEQDRLVYGWLMRDYAQTVGAGLSAKDLPACKDPEWWQHGWIPPARMTVDFGRDGRIYLEEYERGLITTERYFSLKGQDAKEEFISECDFAEFRREEMKRRNLTDEDFGYLRRQPKAAASTEQGEGSMEEPGAGSREEEDSSSDEADEGKKGKDDEESDR